MLSCVTNNKALAPRRQISKEEVVKDPVEVFCRVRPDKSDSSCLKVVNESTLCLVGSNSCWRYKAKGGLIHN